MDPLEHLVSFGSLSRGERQRIYRAAWVNNRRAISTCKGRACHSKGHDRKLEALIVSELRQSPMSAQGPVTTSVSAKILDAWKHAATVRCCRVCQSEGTPPLVSKNCTLNCTPNVLRSRAPHLLTVSSQNAKKRPVYWAF